MHGFPSHAGSVVRRVRLAGGLIENPDIGIALGLFRDLRLLARSDLVGFSVWVSSCLGAVAGAVTVGSWPTLLVADSWVFSFVMAQ